MFNNLIETKPKKPKTLTATVLSIVFHVAAIGGAVYGTLQAKEAIEKPKAEKVEFVEMKEGRAAAAEGEPATATGGRGRAAAAEGLPGADGPDQDPRRAPGHRPVQEGDGRGRLQR